MPGASLVKDGEVEDGEDNDDEDDEDAGDNDDIASCEPPNRRRRGFTDTFPAFLAFTAFTDFLAFTAFTDFTDFTDFPDFTVFGERRLIFRLGILFFLLVFVRRLDIFL
jgi:hypothetical protein